MNTAWANQTSSQAIPTRRDRPDALSNCFIVKRVSRPGSRRDECGAALRRERARAADASALVSPAGSRAQGENTTQRTGMQIVEERQSGGFSWARIADSVSTTESGETAVFLRGSSNLRAA